MLLNDVIIIMESLLNKDLQEAINMLKNKNINYAYDIAYRMPSTNTLYILESKRHNKYNNSYIYLAVKNEGLFHNCKRIIVECKLYQVNKEQIYVVTTLQKYERDTIGLKDIDDVIIAAPPDDGVKGYDIIPHTGFILYGTYDDLLF